MHSGQSKELVSKNANITKFKSKKKNFEHFSRRIALIFLTPDTSFQLNTLCFVDVSFNRKLAFGLSVHCHFYNIFIHFCLIYL